MRIDMHFDSSLEQYTSACGMTMRVEPDTLTPNGNPMGQRWVLRSNPDAYIDFDQYRHDLAERNNVVLHGPG